MTNTCSGKERFLAIFSGQNTKFHVDVGELGKCFRMTTHGRRTESQEPFLGFGKRVGLIAAKPSALLVLKSHE
jgi:hypothetical protein